MKERVHARVLANLDDLRQIADRQTQGRTPFLLKQTSRRFQLFRSRDGTTRVGYRRYLSSRHLDKCPLPALYAGKLRPQAPRTGLRPDGRIGLANSEIWPQISVLYGNMGIKGLIVKTKGLTKRGGGGGEHKTLKGAVK